jgi:hypothetical protein
LVGHLAFEASQLRNIQCRMLPVCEAHPYFRQLNQRLNQ